MLLNKSNLRVIANLLIALPIVILIIIFFALELINFSNAFIADSQKLGLVDAVTLNLIANLKLTYWYAITFVTSPFFYLGLPTVFILQWLLPVDSKQALVSKSVVIDLAYTLFLFAFLALVLPKFKLFLANIFGDPFGGIEIEIMKNLPSWIQIIIGYLVVDFLGWFHHLVRHKVPFLWYFHETHHSQRQLNPFSNARIHVFDYLSANIIKFVPALFFTETLGIVLLYLAIHVTLDHLNHANVKTNLGWLRYVLVTPQSHRVHHALGKDYFDKNFGVSLSIWDHLFGTQHKDYEVYPITGVPDPNFPNDESHRQSIFALLVHQQWYPIKKMLQQLVRTGLKLTTYKRQK